MDPLLIIVFFLYAASAAISIGYLIFQQERLYGYSRIIITVGAMLHVVAIVIGFFQSGHLPITNLRQTLSIAAATMAIAYVGFQYRWGLKTLSCIAIPMIALIMLFALHLPKTPAFSGPLFGSVWLVLHIISIFMGEGALALACACAVLYLLQERAIKQKRPGFLFKRLPSLELIDRSGYGCLVVGFTMLTIGLITGFVYAKLQWGRFWNWDPKEVWSGITWLIYAALLHQRLTMGWRGKRAAIMAIVGFGAILFTFLGVNFLLPGHHGVFTKM